MDEKLEHMKDAPYPTKVQHEVQVLWARKIVKFWETISINNINSL